VTEAKNYVAPITRFTAAQLMRAELPAGQPRELLCDSTMNLATRDAAEATAWHDWPGTRCSPKSLLGEGFAAASGWQCVAAVDALVGGAATAAMVSVAGCNQQTIGARFAGLESRR
jgi:hypothetical protein